MAAFATKRPGPCLHVLLDSHAGVLYRVVVQGTQCLLGLEEQRDITVVLRMMVVTMLTRA